MLKKTITYFNFDGMEVTEDFYFNLSTPELTKLSAKYGGDISAYAGLLAGSGDGLGMLNFIEELVLSSYGIKSEDGKRFVKSPEIREEFEYSAAYAELFETLLLNPEESKAFGAGLSHGARPNAEAAKLIALKQAEKAD